MIPDIMVLGKGLTGGYLPLAITLVTDDIFSRFDGSVADGKALAYGHSYTGNALGCAAALASLEIFEQEDVLENLQPKIEQMRVGLESIQGLPAVREIRQCGFISGVELTDNGDGDLAVKVCVAARRHGLLTRPIRHVVVLMPPLCITADQLSTAIAAIHDSILDVAPHG
jgi:adenosylmethionine---8-amino-7-oxononanoate aminotransferase